MFMKWWYCYVEGRQYGPVTEDVLLEWIRQGNIRPTHHVWTAGLRDWVRACEALPEMFAETVGAGSALSMVPVATPLGTGGLTPNKYLTAQARVCLRGQWGSAVGFCLLQGLIGGAVAAIPTLGGFVSIFIEGPFSLGGAVFFLTLVRNGDNKIGMLFAGFKNFATAVVAHVLISLFTFLWTLLLVVPGIIAALSYSQTFYIIAEDRTTRPLEAIRKSRRMMQGAKWKLFCLGLRFAGWALLCMLTMGIGFLWLFPYIMATLAKFHDDLLAGAPAPADFGGSAPA